MRSDSELLDFLEAEIKREPLLLHDMNGICDSYRPRGLGLMQSRRTLRQAIEAMMPAPPKPAEAE